MISFGVCIGNEETYKSHAFPSISMVAEADSVLLTSRDNASIFEAYNEMLAYLAGKDDLEALILLHEDVELKDPHLLEKVRASMKQPRAGVTGVIGATGVTSLAWWEGQGRGRCDETRGLIDFGGGDHEVDAVDGLFMALSPWAVRTVNFDTQRYSGFHGYDVDYCFNVRQAGGRVAVADIELFHHTKGGFGDEAQYRRCNEIFVEKWSLNGHQGHDQAHEAPPEEEAMSTATIPDTPSLAPTGKDGKVRIDLGGGKIPLEGWVNLDPGHGEGPWRRLAQDVPWPIADDAVEQVYASHMMEHVPAGAERIAVMNEAWRVLKPGGTFEIRVPMFPRWEAIADPTHVSFWVPQSFFYFTGDIAPDADYGMKRWEMGSCVINDGWEIRTVLRKPAA